MILLQPRSTLLLSKGEIVIIDHKLGLVCFQEFIFLETIFPTFPCLATIRKISQRNSNSGQRKIIHLMPGKCFPFLILRKTLSFPLFTKHVNVYDFWWFLCFFRGVGGPASKHKDFINHFIVITRHFCF
jgi:hypothetical protein